MSANDAWCAAPKQTALLQLVLGIHDRALELLRRGVPAADIEQVDLSDAVRVRDRVGADDAAGVEAVGRALGERLEALG